MAVSPQRSPASTPPTEASIPQELIPELSLGEPYTKLRPIESAVLTWGIDLSDYFGAAYVYFEIAPKPIVVSEALGPRLCNEAVLPRIVMADSITWIPIMTNTGAEGHGFILWNDGTQQAMIEATGNEIVVVHSTYSPMAVEAGLVAASTRLCFGPEHVKQLTELIDEVRLDDDLVFLPATELLSGRALQKIPLRVDANVPDEIADEARRIWMQTKSFLRSMNVPVLSGISNHNRIELHNASVSSREITLPNLEYAFD
jgi:hypothetical protein